MSQYRKQQDKFLLKPLQTVETKGQDILINILGVYDLIENEVPEILSSLDEILRETDKLGILLII